MAAIRAFEWIKLEKLENENIVIYSDSKYLIQGITNWIRGWKANGWKTAAKKGVENQDLWLALDTAVRGLSIEWRYVEGHAGHPGNERCDDIATSLADKVDPHLYTGPRDLYTIDLDGKPVQTGAKKKSSSTKAYSYLSSIDGILETHKTWAECEARVKGVKGARFKKATSAEEEEEIKKDWGNKKSGN